MESLIMGFIENLPDAKSDSEALRLDSEVVLKSIEAQHGLLVARAKHIYSFSHLTFQEYFTARKLTLKPSREVLKELVSHLTEKQWREVFFLSFEMLENGTELAVLMKEEIDNLVVKDEKIRAYLTWLGEKVDSLNGGHTKNDIKIIKNKWEYLTIINNNKAIIRFLYLRLYLSLDLSPYIDLSLDLDLSPYIDLDLDLSLDQ